MSDITVSRKQRLRTLENEIRQGMEEFYHIGMKLKEIRDDELYKEDGFADFLTYCHDRFDWKKTYVYDVIKSSEYRAALPSPRIAENGEESEKKGWTEWSVRELRRIEDKKQAARVAAKVVKAVEQSEKAAAKDPDVKPIKLTAATVRKFVDEDLGVNRTARAKETKRQREEQSKIDLTRFLMDLTGRIEANTDTLQGVPKDAWTLLDEDSPDVIKRLIAACNSLVTLLRRAEG
jgi:hypothetical protein